MLTNVLLWPPRSVRQESKKERTQEEEAKNETKRLALF